MIRWALLLFLLACSQTGSEPSRTPSEADETMDPELASHLSRCGNRTPVAEFTENALPWFRAHPDVAVPPLIELVVQGGGSAERAAKALGDLRAEAAVASLTGALMGDLITHQAAAAQALWLIGNEEAVATLRRAIRGGGDPAIRALEAMSPIEGRDPCPLVFLGLAGESDAVSHHARQAAQRLGC